MSHLTKCDPVENGRLYITDIFYTRHFLTKQLLIITDGEANTLGTILINTVDVINRPKIKMVGNIPTRLERKLVAFSCTVEGS